jgi:phenylalanyl-tRNA synthetase beta chain
MRCATINFSFVDERSEHDLAGNADPIRLVNPMASHWAVMRSSLLGSLIGVLRLNLARKATRVRIFEAGRTFRREAGVADGAASVAGVSQVMRLAGLAHGGANALQWGAKDRAVDFFDVKGDIEALLAPSKARFIAAEHPAMHPGRCARVEVDGTAIGFVGELHPEWRQAFELPAAPMLFELDAAALARRTLPTYTPVQRHQSVWRDLSLILGDAVTHEALMHAIGEVGEVGPASLVRSAKLFDLYKPAAASEHLQLGERSLSVRLELLDDTTTLTDERIERAVADVLATLEERLGARLRT